MKLDAAPRAPRAFERDRRGSHGTIRSWRVPRNYEGRGVAVEGLRLDLRALDRSEPAGFSLVVLLELVLNTS